MGSRNDYSELIGCSFIAVTILQIFALLASPFYYFHAWFIGDLGLIEACKWLALTWLVVGPPTYGEIKFFTVGLLPENQSWKITAIEFLLYCFSGYWIYSRILGVF